MTLGKACLLLCLFIALAVGSIEAKQDPKETLLIRCRTACQKFPSVTGSRCKAACSKVLCAALELVKPARKPKTAEKKKPARKPKLAEKKKTKGGASRVTRSVAYGAVTTNYLQSLGKLSENDILKALKSSLSQY